MKKLIDKSLAAMKANLLPGIILQLFALALVTCYFYIPSVNTFCGKIANIKQDYGFFFSGLSTAIFGGLIPFALLLLRKKISKELIISHGLFFFLFWFYKGIEVDALYRLQSLMFGNSNDALTITKKVFFDQLVYNFIYAAMAMTLLYHWKDCGFSFRKWKESLDREMFTETIPVILLSTWMVWFPATAIIYSLPENLQIPLFNIVLCFFVLLVSFLCDKEAV